MPTNAKIYLDLERLDKLTSGLLDEAAVDYFARGHCAAMALALHRLTGWPLRSLDASMLLRSSGLYTGHACVLAPNGMLLDAGGFFTVKQWADSHYLDWDDYRICGPAVSDFAFAADHNDLVLPFARAVLEKYKPVLVNRTITVSVTT